MTATRTFDRRRSTRMELPGSVRADVSGRDDVQVVNLGSGGAMIQHAHRLSPGKSCTLSLYGPGTSLRLSGRIVWSQVHSIGQGPTGEKEIQYRSGLHFDALPAHAEAQLGEYMASLISPKSAPPGET